MKKNNPRNSRPETDGEGAAQWLTFLNLGWMIMGNMLVFVGGGLWLDRHFKTGPILLLIGVFVGFFASGYTLYRAVKKLEGQEAAKPGP